MAGGMYHRHRRLGRAMGCADPAQVAPAEVSTHQPATDSATPRAARSLLSVMFEMTASTPDVAWPDGYAFYGRDPSDWHEELRWYVWFTTPIASWTSAQLDAVAAAIHPGLTCPAFEATATVQIDGELMRVAGTLDHLGAGQIAFAALRAALDQVHVHAPIRQVFVGGVIDVTVHERAHWQTVGSLPDLGTGPGPVAIDDWEVEAVELDGLPFGAVPALDLVLARVAVDTAAAACAAALARGELTFVPAAPPPSTADGDLAPVAAARPGQLLRFRATAPSGRRCVYAQTRPSTAIVEFSASTDEPTIALRHAHAVVSPNQQVSRAAYLDSDDWLVVLTENNSPGAAPALELWRRTPIGFVRTDDVPCDTIDLATAGRFAGVVERQRATIYARVDQTLVDLGHAEVPTGALLHGGVDERLWCTDPARARWTELTNHQAKLAAHVAGAPAAPDPDGQLVAIEMHDRLVDAPADLPPTCRETQSSAGWYWARMPASIDVWDGRGRRSFTPLASVTYPIMSVHPSGTRALFGVDGDRVAELDAVTGAWTVLRTELGRPFYVRVGDHELLGLSTPTGVKIYRRDDAPTAGPIAELDLGAPAGRYDVAATECGLASLVGRDQHLYTLVADGDAVRFERGPALRPPGRRLAGRRVQGRVEDGVGYLYVETARGLGEYCVPASLAPLP